MRPARATRILLLFAIVSTTVTVLAGERAPHESRSDPSAVALQAVVERFAHAIETNNHELALQQVHPRSPWRPEIDSALREQLASHFERARTSRLEPLAQPAGGSSAIVEQDVVRVFGMKFAWANRRSIYRFRLLDGSWRIWRIEELATR